MYCIRWAIFFIGLSQTTQQIIYPSNQNESSMQGCKLPVKPNHGSYSSPRCQSDSSLSECEYSTSVGSTVPSFWLLAYTCEQGYRLPKNDNIYYSRCFDGVWAPVPPVCLDERVVKFISDASLPKSKSKPINGGCLLPKYPAHGRYYTFSCTGAARTSDPGCAYTPGTPVPSTWTITYTCDAGYEKHYSGGRISQYARCTNGTWDIKPPLCIKKCPVLESKTQVFTCFLGASEVDCHEPSMPGTIATYQCQNLWTRDPRDTTKVLTCTSEGEWTYQPPPCLPSCGVSNIDSSHPQIIDGDPAPLGFFPWHAGIYHSAAEGQGWNQFCGGTLIKQRYVLTAAFCVVQEGQDRIAKVMDPQDLRVALGKYYRDWDKEEPTEVKVEVVSVRVPAEYRGSSTTFEFDIAVLELSEDVPLSNTVMPVCMETPELQQPTNNALGYITGWGNSEMLEPSNTVLYCAWPFQDYEACFNNMVKKKDGFITADKFCAGVEVHAAARKSIGGGFSFVVNNKHYIYGILSSQVVRRDEIEYLKDFNYPVFTNVTHLTHKKWIAQQTGDNVD